MRIRLLCLLVTLGAAATAVAGGGESLAPLKGGKAPRNLDELWGDYDPAREPLEAKTAAQWSADGVICRTVLYTIGTFKGVKSRMAAFYAYPADYTDKDKKRLPALLHLHGGGQRASLATVMFAARNGYAAMSINWGAREMESAKSGDPNTDWGKLDATQSGHNSHYSSIAPDDKTLDAVPSPRNNNWFLLVLAARRAITFLQSSRQVDPRRIGVLGHSMGGKLTIDVAGIDKRVRAAAPSCGGSGTAPADILAIPGSGLRPRDKLSLDTIDDRAYIPRVTCPALFLSPTNDFNAPIDAALANWKKIGAREVRFAISPHLNHRHVKEFSICRYLWFDQHLKSSFVMPRTPVLEVKLDGPNGVPTAILKPDQPDKVVRAEIYYSIDPHVLTRFWRGAPAARKGRTWSAPCPIMSTDRSLLVHAGVYYAHGRTFKKHRWINFDGVKQFAISSQLVRFTPAELKKANVKPTGAPSRLIDDFSRGWSDWYRLEWANPHHWVAATRKIKDPKWRGPDGASLAVDVKVDRDADLLFQVIQNNWGAWPGKPKGQYAASRALRGSAKWRRVTVDLKDFAPADKKTTRPLETWRYVTELQLRGKLAGPAKGVKRWPAPRMFARLRWVVGKNASPPAPGVTAPPKEVVKSLKLDPFYKKYVSAGGMAVISSDKVSDYALLEAAYLINHMLEGRPDICKAMIANKSRVAVMGVDEFTTDIPEHSKLKPKGFWDKRARGLGGQPHRPVTSCGEENLLRYKGDPYITENILIHEFAHAIHHMGLVFVDKTFDKRLQKTYENAMKKGLWKGKYASNNRAEYWAEAVQSWFDTNRKPDHDHNHVDTRKELKKYDPGIAKLVAEVFGDKPWKYVRPSKRKDPGHLKGYDRSKAPVFSWPKRVLKAWEELDHDQDVDGEQ